MNNYNSSQQSLAKDLSKINANGGGSQSQTVRREEIVPQSSSMKQKSVSGAFSPTASLANHQGRRKNHNSVFQPINSKRGSEVVQASESMSKLSNNKSQPNQPQTNNT